MAQVGNHVEGITGSISLGNSCRPNIKNHTWWYQGVFSCQEWNSFQLSGKELVYLHLKDFLKYECELYLKQALTQPLRKIIVAYCILNHRLAIKIGHESNFPISRLSSLLSRLWYCLIQLEVIIHTDCHFKFHNCRGIIKATSFQSEDRISIIRSMIIWTLPIVFTIETRIMTNFWKLELCKYSEN